MNWSFALYGVLNTVFVLAISPLFMSLIKKVKARAQRRVGPPLFQTYFQLGKLLRKETVYSTNSSMIMRIVPQVNIVFMLVASLFVPLIFVPDAVGGIGNLILFLYLMVVAKFFMALGGLDAGSTFGGMGSSREMTFSAMVEPVIIIVFAALAFLLNTVNLHEMSRITIDSSAFSNPTLLLISVALFIILIVETARVPVDNPETHLELTMIHEAMILECSGPNLALMEMSHAIKQTLLMGILINVLVPWGLAVEATPGGIALGMVAFAGKGAILAVIVGLFESSIAKFRLFRLPILFMVAYVLSFLTILLELLS